MSFVVLLFLMASLLMSLNLLTEYVNGNMLQVDEQRYYSHMQMIERLMFALKTADDQKNGSGTLSEEDFAAVLTQLFPLKHSQSVDRLAQAAVAELNVTSDEPLLYKNLFTVVRFNISLLLLDAILARYAVIVCLAVCLFACLSLCYKSEFYQDG